MNNIDIEKNLKPKANALLIKRVSFINEISKNTVKIPLTLNEEYYGKQMVYGKVIRQGEEVKEPLEGKYVFYDRYNSKSISGGDEENNIYDFTEFNSSFVWFVLED